jgi:hypothetical protein
VNVNATVPVEPTAPTLAVVPGAPVLVPDTVIVAGAPTGPVGPCGIVKVRATAPVEPLAPTAAVPPGTPVMVLATVIVAAEPVKPVAPVGPVGP